MTPTPRSRPALTVLLLTAFVVALLLPLAATALAAGAPGMSAAAAAAPQETAAVAEQEDAEDEHAVEEAHETAAKPWWHWPFKWANFIMLCGFLYWMLVVPPPAVQDIFSFRGLKVIFTERAAAVLAARDLAAEQKEQAAQTLTASEQRLAKIEEEVAALVADARADADREAERAAEDGKAQAQKIGEVARREVTHESVAAQRQLRGFVADLAVRLAEKNLTEHLTADDQDRLIREYLSRLGPSMA